MFTHERFHPLLWLFNLILIKNVGYHVESLCIELLAILFVSLVFEHLAFAVILEHSKRAREFFITNFSFEILHFCLGNITKSPLRKLGVAAGALGYDVTISVLSEKAGTAVADQSLTQFPDQTLQDYTHI